MDAGDMLLAALLDAGASLDAVRSGLARLAVEPIGLRLSPVRRRSLRRDEVEVPLAGGTVHVKRGFLGDRVITDQPEYDDLLALSASSGVPLAQLNRRAGSAVESSG